MAGPPSPEKRPSPRGIREIRVRVSERDLCVFRGRKVVIREGNCQLFFLRGCPTNLNRDVIFFRVFS